MNNNEFQAYRKGFTNNDDQLAQKYGTGGAKPKKSSKTSSQKSSTFGQTSATPLPVSSAKAELSTKKTKFVDLYSPEGNEKLVVKLPGRHKCECQASKHKLINNCLKCGRIVCDQEGSGPCYHCGNLVCTRDEQDFINRGGKKAEEMRRKLMLHTFSNLSNNSANKSAGGSNSNENANFNLSSISEDFKRATAEKDRLLEYQQNSAKRTTIFDDQADYYNSDNRWLSAEERQKLKKNESELLKAKNPSKLSSYKVSFDFAGRKIVEDVDDMQTYNLPSSEEFYGTETTRSEMSSSAVRNDALDMHPQYLMEYSQTYPQTRSTNNQQVSRIKDAALDELQDKGNCLSMHQPYAGLLVRGIKIHEGRNWYSNHRGLLWIASTAKPVSRDEIKELEIFYRHYHGEKLPAPFPEQYPIGCLLGCVEVVDCLAQEQYRLAFPQGESESPYVMICRNPRELPMKMPISGKHKIYKLDPQIHQAAKAGIEHSFSFDLRNR